MIVTVTCLTGVSVRLPCPPSQLVPRVMKMSIQDPKASSRSRSSFLQGMSKAMIRSRRKMSLSRMDSAPRLKVPKTRMTSLSRMDNAPRSRVPRTRKRSPSRMDSAPRLKDPKTRKMSLSRMDSAPRLRVLKTRKMSPSRMVSESRFPAFFLRRCLLQRPMRNPSKMENVKRSMRTSIRVPRPLEFRLPPPRRVK